ncbi:MAG: 1,4-dihydroxy-6-naphthoate synthase [Sphingobacteriales bacterium]|jgi:1,4-dihydroxy-6-naphthoate synthase|nr:1,4-dihydroxy-6-naphthoate synthase [Sphingobacteriales bacterium]
MKKLSLGFSPCPNDTFIFDALIHHKIDTEGLEFDVFFDDVETLNKKALQGELDITKLSFHAFAHVSDKYVLLDAGSALGFGVGPLLISKTAYTPEEVKSKPSLCVGIPGTYTTANFLLGIAFPALQNKKELVFSAIEESLLNEAVNLGVIIHENRFTYAQKGLHKVMDLGDYWEQETGMPIPLGGILIKRNIDTETQHTVNRLIRKSVEYAFANPEASSDFVRHHAQELDESVRKQHIDLYVNKYSIDLGNLGKQAIRVLFEKGQSAGLISASTEQLFLS